MTDNPGPSSGVERIWLRPEDVEKLRLALHEGFSHVNLQVRVDREDDYYNVVAVLDSDEDQS